MHTDSKCFTLSMHSDIIDDTKGKDTRFSGSVGMAILWRFMQVFL